MDVEFEQKGTGRKAKVNINVPKIIEAEDGQAAVVALKAARRFAVNGDIMQLMDLLAPEGKRTVKPKGKGPLAY